MARLLTAGVVVPRPIEEVFAFFAAAANLERLTPGFLSFKILTPPPVELRAGALIDYRLRLHGVPIRWRTLISAWEPPHRFVDEQVRGPYRLWRHEHTFEAVPGGTLCRDRVEYAHWGGSIGERWLVRPRLERIFAFRRAAMLGVFAGAGETGRNGAGPEKPGVCRIAPG